MTYEGTIYWSQGDLVEWWDSSTGAISALTRTDPRIPSAVNGQTLGTVTTLADGRLLVRVRPPGADMTALAVGSTGIDLWTAAPEVDTASGWVDYDYGSGVFDSSTGINWLDWAPQPFEWTGFDASGAVVATSGDVRLIGPGNAARYIGSSGGEPSNAALLGRTLYRWGPQGDVLIRCSLDTGAWQGVYPLPDTTTGNGTESRFVGVSNTLGLLVSQNTEGAGADRGYVQTRDPNGQPWGDIVALGGNLTGHDMTAPGQQWNPWGPGGPPAGTILTTQDERSGTIMVRGDFAYYFSRAAGYGIDYSDDAGGFGQGVVDTMWEMNLTDGSISKLFDVPFRHYAADGTVVSAADPLYWYDNNNNVYGITAVPEPVILPPIRHAPLLRKYPLDIGRKYPPSKAQQYGGRRVGSYL